MRDLLADYDRLAAAGPPVGRAVVTGVWGSAPRPEGSCLLASSVGLAGSVSGGCVEGAVAAEILAALERGSPRRVSYGVSHEEAWTVGLACGGTIELLVEPGVRPELLEAARGSGGVVIATALGEPALGTSWVVREDGTVVGPLAPLGRGPDAPATSDLPAETIRDAALAALRRELSRTVELAGRGGPVPMFLEVIPRRPTLIVFGGVHIAQELVPLAKRLGYRTVVADGRQAFLDRARFPDADELVLAWPEEAFARIGIDAATYVCVLSHDPKFDEPACELALRSPAAYVGAIGSRKTQAARRERLRRAGLGDEALARLRGPIGLDLGGRGPAETALAILAEMTAVRYGGTGAALSGPAEGAARASETST
ncbi:MAG TPA: XdhC family protein [Gemmatimonadales bacterium]|nr:XdhC family protein [Gemmatimonadales bacterium]